MTCPYMHLYLTFSVFVAPLLGAAILFALESKKNKIKKSMNIIAMGSVTQNEVTSILGEKANDVTCVQLFGTYFVQVLIYLYLVKSYCLHQFSMIIIIYDNTVLYVHRTNNRLSCHFTVS